MAEQRSDDHNRSELGNARLGSYSHTVV